MIHVCGATYVTKHSPPICGIGTKPHGIVKTRLTIKVFPEITLGMILTVPPFHKLNAIRKIYLLYLSYQNERDTTLFGTGFVGGSE